MKDAGSTSFYHADFQRHRLCHYKNSWDAAPNEYSEEINIYLRRFNFIASHAAESKRAPKYKKHLISQLSKYEIVLLYFYALVSDDPDFQDLFFKPELQEEVHRDECRLILFDIPSKKIINDEPQNIKDLRATKKHYPNRTAFPPFFNKIGQKEKDVFATSKVKK